jgi:hypothetical protein
MDKLLKLDKISFRELQWWLRHYCFKELCNIVGSIETNLW